MKTILAALILALGATTAHASIVSWSFSGAPYDGSVADLGGPVIVTLDDEGTAKTVKIKIDASGSSLPADSYIRWLFLNTKDIDSDVGANAISVSPLPPAGGLEAAVSNEDGFTAGSGGDFDFRLAFFEDGTDYFLGGEIFEATLNQNLNDLLVSSFFDTSVDGAAGAFEMALLIRSPDDIEVPAGQRTSDYFAGVRIGAVPIPAAIWLFGTALVGFIGVSRRRKVA